MENDILVLTNTSNGAFMFRQELLEALLKKYCVTIISTNTGRIEELERIGCKTIVIPIDCRGKNPIKDAQLLQIYKKLCKQFSPRLIITYTIKPNIYGGLISRLNHIPYATNITGLGTAFERRGLLRLIVTVMYRFALKKAKVVFFENENNYQLFIEEKIIHERQACLLCGAGVNLMRFSLLEYPNNEIFRFLFIGRIMKEKGIEELISVMRRIAAEGYTCILDVVGSYEEDYTEIFMQAERDGWLKYHGQQMDVRPFIKDCDCFVLPSWHEGMANTNLECAASGRPVITSDIPGCKEAVIDGVSGFLCEFKNVDSLYEKMKRMLSLSADERSRMGIAGRKHMEDQFDKKKVVEKTIHYLEL